MLPLLSKVCAFFVSNIDLTTFLVFTVVFLFVLCVISTPRSDIPGPFALPFFGNLYFLARIGNRRYRETLRLQKQYGDIFRLYIGKQMMVTICGYENIHDAFVKHAAVLSNRPEGLFKSQTKYGNLEPGIILSNGEVWRKNRRFTIQTMRDFGMGKKSLEVVIAEEAKLLCDDIAAFNGKPIENIKDLLSVSVSNTVHSVVFGYRCEHDDEEFLAVIKSIETLFKVPSIFYRVLPVFVQRLIGTAEGEREKALEDVMNYVQKRIAEHEQTFDKNNLRDLVDRFLSTIPPEEDTKKKFLHMYQVVLEMFAAGTDTTATTLAWMILYILENPDVQEKCYHEIKKVVGLNRCILYSDRNNLPYLEATMLELQRCANIASSFMHYSTEDVLIGGYVIPKNTMVSAFLPSVHLDPERFPEPMKIRPERFLDEKSGKVVNRDMLMPFSIGPRICPGETLAKTEMFIIFGNLVQKFKLCKVSPDDVLSFEGLTGSITYSEPYRLRAEARN